MRSFNSHHADKASSKLRSVVRKVNRIEGKVSDTQSWLGAEAYEHEAKELRDDLDQRHKEIENIWTQNIQPWYEEGLINEADYWDLVKRKNEALQHIEKARDVAAERGKTRVESLQSWLGRVSSVLSSLVTVISAGMKVKRQLTS
jgi:hypothetical protein